MHRLRFVLRHADSVERSASLAFRRNLNAHRALCSQKSGNDDDDVDKPSDNIRKERSKQAKSKLDNLLKSIVENSKKDASRKLDTPAIDMKLAVPVKEKSPSNEEQKQSTEEKELELDLGKDMVSAVKKVAESIEGDSEVVESELVQKLKTQVGKKINLSDLFSGMKIDRSSQASSSSAGDIELSRAHRVRRLLNEKTKESKRTEDRSHTSRVTRQKRIPVSRPSYIPIDLFGAPPLGIFTVKTDTKTETTKKVERLETWDLLAARDLKLSVTHPPANGFEEMILWTEQGKLWKFPIDNEQGLEDEAAVPFHEHVFLEPQLESWCPKKGPIRHFMELVCVGLSKNPFLTVKEKHEQIEWYHQYFKEKASIIKDVGAGDIK